MLVLGVETSCDETGIALYCTHRGLLADELHSQAKMHEQYGGVVPELASRDHVRRLSPLLELALQHAAIKASEIDAVAYTQGPGLAGALLTGAAFAAGLAASLGVELLPIHHLEAHLLSPLLASPAPQFPFLVLLVSGGHTMLLDARGLGDYQLLGDTLDDAAGEAFDKSAKLLGLGYPGGPLLAQAALAGNPGVLSLPRPLLHDGSLNFSFSGLKTAVWNASQRGYQAADLALEVQTAIVEVLLAKTAAALKTTARKNLVVAGGVSANLALRQGMSALAAKHQAEVFYPPLKLCTDNGAMVALAGALHWQARAELPTALTQPRDYLFSIRPRWSLSELATAGLAL